LLQRFGTIYDVSIQFVLTIKDTDAAANGPVACVPSMFANLIGVKQREWIFSGRKELPS